MKQSYCSGKRKQHWTCFSEIRYWEEAVPVGMVRLAQDQQVIFLF